MNNHISLHTTRRSQLARASESADVPQVTAKPQDQPPGVPSSRSALPELVHACFQQYKLGDAPSAGWIYEDAVRDLCTKAATAGISLQHWRALLALRNVVASRSAPLVARLQSFTEEEHVALLNALASTGATSIEMRQMLEGLLGWPAIAGTRTPAARLDPDRALPTHSLDSDAGPQTKSSPEF